MRMRLHWQLRKLQCPNLYTHVITCHVTRATSLAVVGTLTKARFPNSQSEEYFLHSEVYFLHTTSTGISINWIHPSDRVPAAWEHLEQQNSSSRCLWTPKWAFSQHQPWFHNSSLANKLCLSVLKRRRDLGQGLGRERNHIARSVPLFTRKQQCQVGTSTLKCCWVCWGRGRKESAQINLCWHHLGC